MRTMFVKLFVWFWLATILSGVVFFLLAFNLRLAPMHEEHKRHFDAEEHRILSQTLSLYGRTAAALWEQQGTRAGIFFGQSGSSQGRLGPPGTAPGPARTLEEPVRNLEGPALTLDGPPRPPEGPAPPLEGTVGTTKGPAETPDTMRAYLFSVNGSALSEGAAPPVSAAVRRLVAAGGDHVAARVGRDFLVVKVLGPSGKNYLAATRVGPGSPPPEQPWRLPYPFPPEFLLQMLITFVVSGLVCYLLSWRITAPVRRLRAAVQGLATGDLATRVAVNAGVAGDELSDLGRDFNQMAGRIEKLVTAHQQLVRDVSHELRSPLARLNVALGLARKQSPPSAEPALDRIELEGERLNQLIGELLTLSKLENGAAGERTDVDLSELADEVARDADFEARACNRRVSFAPLPGLVLQGNREMLRRALENVMRNAVRYTAEGSAVTVTLEDAAGRQGVLRVRDFGPGVPQELLSDIFRPFFRVAQARDRQSGGTGIGLAISEKTVILHGGTISARNLSDAGLEVEIRLPLAPRR